MELGHCVYIGVQVVSHSRAGGVEESVASVCAFNTDRSAYLLQDLRVFTISVDKPKIGQEKSGFDLSWLDVMTNL